MQKIFFVTIIMTLALSVSALAAKPAAKAKKPVKVQKASEETETTTAQTSSIKKMRNSDEAVPYPAEELDQMDASKSEIKGEETQSAE
jgi:hypothetical protein